MLTTTQAAFLLFDLAIIVVAARAFGALAVRFGQPAVIGEIVSGILFGATLFNGLISRTLFPVEVRPLLAALANVGVAVFMFLVGLELDRKVVRGRIKVALTLSVSSVVLPFAMGIALAYALAGRHAPEGRPGFVLYIGAALSVTAFPVLVRILRDRNMFGSPIGVLACSCAAIADLLAWTLLAVVVAISQPSGTEHWRLALALPYLVVLVWVVRPLLRRYLSRDGGGQITASTLAVVMIGMLLSSAATEWMGLHFIFGAFAFGVLVPKDVLAVEVISTQVGRFNEVLLLPVFFVIAGLKVDLSAVDGAGLGELALILLAAIGGKVGGTFLAARAHGIGARQSATLAALMNTRGLTELIILATGRELGLLDDRLYTLMVLMALLTTAMTGPLLTLLKPGDEALFLPTATPVAARKG